MPPVCSNCGAAEFVWANDLKTGSMGRGGLSLRRGGELALGTRICRSCGHADLFVKDPTFLRQPHTWKPGEFVPIAPKPDTSPAPRSEPTPSSPSPPSPGTPSVPTPEPLMPVPASPPSPEPELSGGSAASGMDSASESPATAEEAAPKKSSRRRKSKAAESPPSP